MNPEDKGKEQFPKIVKIEGGVDPFREMVKEFYLAIFLKNHEIYTPEKIFALALNAAQEFDKCYKELHTRINVNFEKEVADVVGPDVAKKIATGRKER